MATPSEAEYVVIGAGAIGCGVAHALARAGKKDIVVVERASGVAQATTSQGAGLCGQARNSVERVRLAMQSVATFRELQKDPEVTPDWNEVGSLRLALGDRRVEEFRELVAVAQLAGLEATLIENAEAKRRWPLIDFSSVRGVLWVPTDGYMTPTRVAQAYEHRCRKLGVRFVLSAPVEAIQMQNGRVAAVQTAAGTVKCRYAINAAGAHAYHIAQLAGLELPIVPVRHEYFITVPMPGLTPSLPCFRIPEMTLYGRVRDGGLLLGGWEPRALHTDPRSYRLHADPPPVEPDWRVLDSFEDQFRQLFPQSSGQKKAFVGKGWPTFTPDGRFIIGESALARGFVMAGGCNAHGISGSAGIGELLLQSLFDPKPSEYVRSLSPDRFAPGKWNWDQACRDAQSVYETYYGV